MNLRDLEYVDAVGRYLSFSRAAAACNVSQPALSNQIKKLEHELGLELFHRGSQTVRMTEFGERVIESAQTLLAQAQRIRDMALECKDPTAVPLKIGMTKTLAPYLASYLCKKVKELAPDLKVILTEDGPEALSESVCNRDIDIAFLPKALIGRGQDFSPVFDEPVFLAVGPDHPLSSIGEIGIDAVPRRELICSQYWLGFEAEANIRRGSPELGNDVVVDVSAASFETVCRHVSHGEGCTFVPALAAEQFKRDNWNLTFIRMKEPEHVRKIGVISRLGCPRKPMLLALRDHIHQELPVGVHLAAALQ